MKKIITILLACCLAFGSTTPAKAYDPKAPYLSIDEVILMAKVMELENGCNSDRCLMLTGSVILNRRQSPDWPNTVQGVIYQKGQYADWTLRHIPTVEVTGRVMALALKLWRNGSVDKEIVFQSMHPELGKVKYHVDTEYFATER